MTDMLTRVPAFTPMEPFRSSFPNGPTGSSSYWPDAVPWKTPAPQGFYRAPSPGMGTGELTTRLKQWAGQAWERGNNILTKKETWREGISIAFLPSLFLSILLGARSRGGRILRTFKALFYTVLGTALGTALGGFLQARRHVFPQTPTPVPVRRSVG